MNLGAGDSGNPAMGGPKRQRAGPGEYQGAPGLQMMGGGGPQGGMGMGQGMGGGPGAQQRAPRTVGGLMPRGGGCAGG